MLACTDNSPSQLLDIMADHDHNQIFRRDFSRTFNGCKNSDAGVVLGSYLYSQSLWYVRLLGLALLDRFHEHF